MKKLVRESLLLGSLSFSVLLSSIGTSMANIALPAISTEFTTSVSNARWIVLSYLLASTFFSLGIGRLGDLNGRRKVLLLGTLLFSIATLACGFSPSFDFLVLARLVQGMGGAALIVLPIALAMEVVPTNRTGHAIGLLATMSAIGTASGPSIGGFILEGHGWRAAFFLMAALGMLSFVLLYTFVPATPTLFQKQDGLSLSTLLGSVNLDPLLRTQLIYNLIVAAVMMTTLITGPYYLTYGLHLEPGKMGLIMSVGPITSAVFGIFSGYLVDRYGALPIIRIGLFQLLVGALSFAASPSLFGTIGFSVSAFLLSTGYQLFLSANSASIMKSVSSDQRGFASGAISLSRNFGLIGGAYVMGGFFDFFAGASHPITTSSNAISYSFQMTFTIAASLIACLLIHYSKNQKKERA